MIYAKVILELSRNPDIFKGLLTELPEEEYRWKPNPGKWCLLEIVCHLIDEECEDFRARTRHVLETPKEPMPPIDPKGWVKERNYIGQDYTVALDQFVDERKQSVKWLESLVDPQWDNAYSHPKFGEMTAKMFLFNWLAHDYFHIRQISNLKIDYLKNISGESLTYASG